MAAICPFALPSGRFSGDTFPFFRDGLCHLFHMMPPLLGHHVSRDLLHWQARPVAVTPGRPGEADSANLATGSVIEHQGRFHLFYTGNQNVCLATSDDLDHWVKHPANPLLAGDDRLYAAADFRDPFVFWNDAENCFWMLFGTRLAGALAARGGCVGLAKSANLEQWTAMPPLWAPGIGPHCDCPQILAAADRVWLLYLQRNTRYRVAPSLAGPFDRPSRRNLGTQHASAASRPACDGQRWISLPFFVRLAGQCDAGAWEYGGPLCIPRHLTFHAAGEITEQPAAEILAAVLAQADPGDPLPAAQPLAGDWELAPRTATCRSTTGGTLLLTAPTADCYLEADVTLERQDSDFHLLLRCEPTLLNGYQLALHARTGQASLRSISRWDCDRVLASHAVPFAPGLPHRLRLFLAGSCLELFIDDRHSLSCRVYDRRDGQLCLEFRDGPGTVANLAWRPLAPPNETGAS